MYAYSVQRILTGIEIVGKVTGLQKGVTELLQMLRFYRNDQVRAQRSGARKRSQKLAKKKVKVPSGEEEACCESTARHR